MKTILSFLAFISAVSVVNAQQIIQQTTTTVTTYTTNPSMVNYSPNWFGPNCYSDPSFNLPTTNNSYVNFNFEATQELAKGNAKPLFFKSPKLLASIFIVGVLPSISPQSNPA